MNPRIQTRFLMAIALLCLAMGMLSDALSIESFTRMWTTGAVIFSMASFYNTQYAIEQLREEIKAEQEDHMKMFAHGEREQ